MPRLVVAEPAVAEEVVAEEVVVGEERPPRVCDPLSSRSLERQSVTIA